MQLEISDSDLVVRAYEEQDIDFLKKVYYSTREEEMKRVPEWTYEMKEAFLLQQFEAQRQYYEKNYPSAAFYVVQYKGIKAGRLYITDDFENTIRIIDIALLPAFQRIGIGSKLLKAIQEKGRQLQRDVTIHVESFNPAKAWYEKLGFKKVSETNGVYHLMQWNYRN